MAEYQAGLRNLNTSETRTRRYKSMIWIALAILMFVWLVLVEASSISRVLVAVPLFVGILHGLEVRNRFGVLYGMQGIQNVDEDNTRAHQLMHADALAADKKRSLQLIVQAGLLAGFITILAVLIP